MTVSEAILKTQERGAGFWTRSAVKYAQTLLEPGETVTAAVTANIATRKEHFPGVVVLTDRRILAVCDLPGIRRCVSCAKESVATCVEKPSAIHYKATFSDGNSAYSMTVDPDTGEKFSRQIAVLKGRAEEFDAASAGADSVLFNPTLIRNQRRVRQAREQAKETRKSTTAGREAGTPPVSRESARETAAQLAEELDAARKKNHVEDTDPLAVAARLAAELANQESE